MIKLTRSGYTLKQNENSDGLLTIVTIPDGKIFKVFGIKLSEENIFRIIAETRRSK